MFSTKVCSFIKGISSLEFAKSNVIQSMVEGLALEGNTKSLLLLVGSWKGRESGVAAIGR